MENKPEFGLPLIADGNKSAFLETPTLHARMGASHNASVFGSSMNLANTVVGAGILSLPFAYSKIGAVLGPALVIGVAILVLYSIHLLLKSGLRCDRASYGGLAKYCFGRNGSQLVKFIIIINNLGLCCAYLVIFKTIVPDMLNELLHSSFLVSVWGQRLAILIVTICVLFPLTFLKTMDELKLVSAFSICCVIFLVMILVRDCIVQKHDTHKFEHVDMAKFSFQILRRAPIIALAFTCQFNVFPIYTELRRRTTGRMMMVAAIALGLCASLYFIEGLSGYLTYGASTNSNILENLKTEGKTQSFKILVHTIKICFIMSVLCTFPTQFFSLRKNMDALLFEHHDEISIDKYIDEKTMLIHRKKRQFWVGTISLFSLMLIPMFVDDLSKVFEVVGATAAVSISYILPSAFYIRVMFKTEHRKFFDPSNIYAVMMLIFGIFCFFACGGAVLYGEITGN